MADASRFASSVVAIGTRFIEIGVFGEDIASGVLDVFAEVLGCLEVYDLAGVMQLITAGGDCKLLHVGSGGFCRFSSLRRSPGTTDMYSEIFIN